MRTMTMPDKNIMSNRARHPVLRRMLAAMLVLLATLMLPTACSKESANPENPPPNELEQALANGRATLAGFVGDDCCQTITPALEELAVDYDGTYNILIFEAADHGGLFDQYEITLTPTQVYFDGNGEEVERVVGRSNREEMVNRLAAMGA
jgi:hypothetical protein